jgi:hypothetical protein
MKETTAWLGATWALAKLLRSTGPGSHGETYVNPGNLLWWSVGGELVGEAPARLGFLKRIMSEAPYAEMEPAPELIVNGNPLITALAKRGSYYLFHFGQTMRLHPARRNCDARDAVHSGRGLEPPRWCTRARLKPTSERYSPTI